METEKLCVGEELLSGGLHLGLCCNQIHFRKISLETSMENGLGKAESRRCAQCWNVLPWKGRAVGIRSLLGKNFQC